MRLIDADEVMPLIEDKQKALCPAGLWGRRYVHGTDKETFEELEELLDKIRNIPTIDPIRHGYWVIDSEETDEEGNQECHCSECGTHQDKPKSLKVPYCWWCGAKMDA